MLHIKMLGQFSIAHGDAPVQPAGGARMQILLAHLLLQRNAPLSRRHLAFTLWPDSSEGQALTNLRRELHNLRQVLPAADDFLSVHTQTIQWRSDAPFTLDVADFQQALAKARQAEKDSENVTHRIALIEATAAYQGDLLPGCYDDWVLGEREKLRHAYLDALEKLVVTLQREHEYRSAIAYAQQLLHEDPLAELAYLHLMHLHALNGDRAGALRIYHRCVTVLKRELDVEPGPAIQQAYEEVLNAIEKPPAQPVARAFVRDTPPLVGRDNEIQAMLACWHRVAGGQSHFLVVTGEAGIGKTRLVEEFLEALRRTGVPTAVMRCYAAEGELAYAPVADLLRSPAMRERIGRLEDIWLTQIGRLLPEILVEHPHLPPPEPMTEIWQQQRLFEALAQAVLSIPPPLALVVDDLQWADRETLAWLHYLLRYRSPNPLLIVGAIRSAEIDAQKPLRSLLVELRRTDRLTEIPLGALSKTDTISLANQIAGAALQPGAASQLYTETEGHPLFVVEMVRAGEIAGGAGAESALPPKIHAVIEARLVQLSSAARRIANMAAAIGRSFVFDVLAAASHEDEDTLVRGLDELWRRQIIREQSDTEYDFSHDKIREVTYASLSMANRRLLHRRIAAAMEAVYAPNLDRFSHQIAHHYDAAGLTDKAIAYYQRAGQKAQHIYANADAVQLFTRALELLEALPESYARAEQELTLLRCLSVAYRNMEGYAAVNVGDVLMRARRLCEELDDGDALGSILWGLFSVNFVRADLRQALRLSEELEDLMHRRSEPLLQLQAHHASGGTLFSLGRFEESLRHFEQGIALYTRDQHGTQLSQCGVDLGVFCHAWSAHPLWHLGFPERALQRSREANRLAESLGHPFSQALAMAYAAMLAQFSGESTLTWESAQATIEFCAQNDIVYYNDWAGILHGWGLAKTGYQTEGLEETQKSIDSFRQSNSRARLSYYLTLLAELYGDIGQVTTALKLLSEALDIARQNRDLWYIAETHRIMGELLVQSGDVDRAVTSLTQSLEISRHQRAHSFELRTAISLARVWHDQNRIVQAQDVLEQSMRDVTQTGSHTDLAEARLLLQRLAEH